MSLIDTIFIENDGIQLEIEVYEENVYIDCMGRKHNTKNGAIKSSKFFGDNNYEPEVATQRYLKFDGNKFYNDQSMEMYLRNYIVDKIVKKVIDIPIEQMTEKELDTYHKVKEKFPDTMVQTVDYKYYKIWVEDFKSDSNAPLRIPVYKNISGTFSKVDIKGYELGDHYFHYGNYNHKLSQEEDLNDFPSICMTYNEHYINFYPNPKNIIYKTITANEQLKELQTKIANSLENEIKSGSLTNSFLKQINGYCKNIPENYEFKNFTSDNPPLIDKLLCDEELIYDIDDVQRKIIYDELSKFDSTVIKTNKPSSPGTLLKYITGKYGDTKILQDECPDKRYSKNGWKCLVLHSKGELVITREHINARNEFNKCSYSYVEILQKWRKYYDECFEKMFKERMNGIIFEDIQVPSIESFKDLSYTFHWNYILDTNERTKFELKKHNWRDFIVYCGCIGKNE